MVKSLRLALAVASMCFAVIANAQSTKSYTETLVVTINEESTDPQPTTVDVEFLENGNINFTLKNFALGQGEDAMTIGNIALKDIVLTDEGYCKSFTFDGETEIEAGDDPEAMYIGPMLGAIPLKLAGKMTDDKLYVTINIDMSATLEQIIFVKLGEDIEAPAEPVGPAVVSSKNYTETLVVTINEESTDPQPTTILVETLENGNINFTLKNFALGAGEDAMAIGNIALKDIALTDEGYCKSFAFDGETEIEAGDDPEAMYIGPMLGAIPLKLAGKMTDDKLYVTINIDMSATLEQIINVKLGEDILDPVEVSISSVSSAANATATFDLSGRRVQNLVKGNVYILNGKKVIK